MSIGLVAYHLRKAGADIAEKVDQLKLNAKYLESELSKHKWSAHAYHIDEYII